MAKFSILIGTRPEIIKLSPIIRKLNKSKADVIFSGQHFDYKMGLSFVKELGLREPDYKLRLEKKSPAEQIAEMINKISKILRKTNPQTIIVEGDTNTVLAGSIAGLKCNIPVSHVEAGIRSFDWRMPEEHNRILADHISELLFAPTQTSKQNLVNERVHGKTFVTGNTVIDALQYNVRLAEKKSRFDLEHEYVLLTLHRAENVDNKTILGEISKAILESNEKIIFPVHPRTKKRLSEFGFYNKIKNSKNITLLDPVGYFKMLLLMKNCKFIITDSGGIQEEATSPKIRKKVLVLRKTTDRPEAVKVGMAELTKLSKKAILRSIKNFLKNSEFPKRQSPYGNGKSSENILKILNQNKW